MVIYKRSAQQQNVRLRENAELRPVIIDVTPSITMIWEYRFVWGGANMYTLAI